MHKTTTAGLYLMGFFWISAFILIVLDGNDWFKNGIGSFIISIWGYSLVLSLIASFILGVIALYYDEVKEIPLLMNFFNGIILVVYFLAWITQGAGD